MLWKIEKKKLLQIMFQIQLDCKDSYVQGWNQPKSIKVLVYSRQLSSRLVMKMLDCITSVKLNLVWTQHCNAVSHPWEFRWGYAFWKPSSDFCKEDCSRSTGTQQVPSGVFVRGKKNSVSKRCALWFGMCTHHTSLCTRVRVCAEKASEVAKSN